MFSRGSVEAKVGMPVTVDLAGFRRYGISIDERAPAGGRVVALGQRGVTVKLNVVLGGLDTVTVKPDRVAAAA